MATIDYSLVVDELRLIRDASKILKQLVRRMFEQLEENPGVYEELEEVDPSVCAAYQGLTLRKISLVHQHHSYRVIFAHWVISESGDHAELLLAFPRSEGYRIDWQWIAQHLTPPS